MILATLLFAMPSNAEDVPLRISVSDADLLSVYAIAVKRAAKEHEILPDESDSWAKEICFLLGPHDRDWAGRLVREFPGASFKSIETSDELDRAIERKDPDENPAHFVLTSIQHISSDEAEVVVSFIQGDLSAYGWVAKFEYNFEKNQWEIVKFELGTIS